jgi:hypothetical protein
MRAAHDWILSMLCAYTFLLHWELSGPHACVSFLYARTAMLRVSMRCSRLSASRRLLLIRVSGLRLRHARQARLKGLPVFLPQCRL